MSSKCTFVECTKSSLISCNDAIHLRFLLMRCAAIFLPAYLDDWSEVPNKRVTFFIIFDKFFPPPRFFTYTNKKSPISMFFTYSKASRYTASSCTDLDSARFWIGSKKIWDARFFDKLLEMHVFLRSTNFGEYFLEMHELP